MNVFFISLCLYGCLCVSLFVCVWQFHFCNYSAYKLTYIKLLSIWFRFMSHFVLDLKKKKNKNRKYIWFASHFFQLSCKLQFIKDWSLSRYQIFGLNFIKMISEKETIFPSFWRLREISNQFQYETIPSIKKSNNDWKGSIDNGW